MYNGIEDKKARFHPIRSYSAGGAQILNVSRNVVREIGTMSNTNIIVLISLIEAFRDYCKMDVQQLVDEAKNMPLLGIRIPRDLFSYHHGSGTVNVNEMLKMLELTVQYSYKAPGQTEDVIITGILSAASYNNGSYYVDVSPKAIPWLLYCGKQVGFAKAEKNVLIKLSLYQKRLYLHLMSIYDHNRKVAEKNYSLKELLEVIGMPPNTPFGKVHERVLSTFEKKLTDLKSRYTVLIIPKMKPPTGRGRRLGDGFAIVVGPRFNDRDEKKQYEILFNEINQVLKNVQNPLEGNKATDISQTLESNGNVEDFLCRLSKVSRDNIFKWANTAAKILYEDYGIPITKKWDAVKNKNPIWGAIIQG